MAAAVQKKIKESVGDKAFLITIYIVLTLVVIAVLYPLIFIISSSISSPAAVTSGRVWLWPVDISFKGFKVLLNTPEIITGYGNSIFYTAAGTLISITLTVMIAYPLSRKGFFGRNTLMMIITFTMIFSGGLIPTYLVVKEMHLIDTRWALLIPNAIWVWQVIIARSFFQSSIPEELLEASEIDGCSDMRFIWSVVLPLSKPILAVLVLMYAVGQWNAYFDALIYLKSADLFPLQLVLRSIIIQNNSAGGAMDVGKLVEKQQLSELLKYSLIVIATLPVLVIYPFVQRYFVQGMLVGSVKG
ncbi:MULTISPECIES: carbohydrate ABC transporter permease [Paenibacillus]|jgi:putative aldouronate transport system permease protein|uniref:Sugar ABC transporter permease n=1 Tax=Paenibacillus odorifer TaxID=189426 RepID=A0A1R0X260_9BACL|nr:MULTISPECIES: carbohydrate ABC transporter permease [Paenibacillus]AIQ75830.1 sugar ABC transporter permease [Paenibacillus odorifer]ETT56953.1 binding-protein-dependent transport system inner membrane protein [Paenibacillus sp. FSL H8-237]MDH6429866.1 putative aldouronate transport system permease protein [Paenibacillus sp. PastH-4]MDH6446034.1 putative aldouronate transport system permease protein [Paenibacillus sp. PastF-4]MDH6530497.1 putative aldouronate transport system permease prote